MEKLSYPSLICEVTGIEGSVQQKLEEKESSLIKEGGHGVVGSGAFHSEGLHLLLCGFAYLLQAVVRSLPLVDLHHLRYLLQPLLLGAQGLQHDRQLSALYQGKRNAHGYFQGICFLRVYTIVIKCYTYKPVHLLSVYTLKLKLRVAQTVHPFQLFFLFGFVFLVAAAVVVSLLVLLLILLLLLLHLFLVHLEDQIRHIRLSHL